MEGACDRLPRAALCAFWRSHAEIYFLAACMRAFFSACAGPRRGGGCTCCAWTYDAYTHTHMHVPDRGEGGMHMASMQMRMHIHTCAYAHLLSLSQPDLPRVLKAYLPTYLPTYLLADLPP